MIKQLSKEEAIQFEKDKEYLKMDTYDRAYFQLNQERLTMPWGTFHMAIEKILNRPVYTHEFAYPLDLLKELKLYKKPPTLEEILGKLTTNKNIAPIQEKSSEQN